MEQLQKYKKGGNKMNELLDFYQNYKMQLMGSTNLFLVEMEKKLRKVKEEMDRLKKENQELKEKLKKE
jgi:uncharacterized protein YbgA (DUF1722 family)